MSQKINKDELKARAKAGRQRSQKKRGMTPEVDALQKSVSRFDFDVDLAKFTDRQMEAARHLDWASYTPPRQTVKYLLYGGALGGG